MNVTIDFGQVIISIVGFLMVYLLNGVRSDIRGLRNDITVERNARGTLESEVAAMKALCAERHKNE